MQMPVQLVFHGMETSEAIDSLVRQKVDWLEQFCGAIVSCRVVIEEPHRRHRHGNLFNMHIHLHVPGEEIVVTHEPGQRHRDEDAYVSIHDAFDAARRQLEDYARRRRRQTKAHEPHWSMGEVADTFPDDGFGFIRCADDRRVYFHRNSVERGRFAQLLPGTTVMFIEDADEDGPHAAAVRWVARSANRAAAAPAFPKHRGEAPW